MNFENGIFNVKVIEIQSMDQSYPCSSSIFMQNILHYSQCSFVCTTKSLRHFFILYMSFSNRKNTTTLIRHRRPYTLFNKYPQLHPINKVGKEWYICCFRSRQQDEIEASFILILSIALRILSK